MVVAFPLGQSKCSSISWTTHKDAGVLANYVERKSFANPRQFCVNAAKKENCAITELALTGMCIF